VFKIPVNVTALSLFLRRGPQRLAEDVLSIFWVYIFGGELR